MFGKLKDRCKIQTGYDRYAHTFLFRTSIAAIAIFWLNQ